MNPFTIVKESMKPVTESEWFVWALLDLASEDYSSGWTAGTSKRDFVVNYFRQRYSKESPVYQRLATMLN